MKKEGPITRLVRSRNHVLNSVTDPNANLLNKMFYWMYVLLLALYIFEWGRMLYYGLDKIKAFGPVTVIIGTGFTFLSFIIEVAFFYYLLHQVVRQTKAKIYLKNLKGK